MSDRVERKIISICFLDLLHRLAIQARAKPDEVKYLNAIVRAVEEIKKIDGIAGGNNRISRIAGQDEWEKMLCRVFQIQTLNQEELTEVLYFYPTSRSITKIDYDTLLLVFGKASSLIEKSNPDLVRDYLDAIHVLPEALKFVIDRKRFYFGISIDFKNKWPDFLTSDEFSSLEKHSLQDPPLLDISIYLRGDQLDPAHITEVLGIQPSSYQKKGEVRPGSKGVIAKIGVWALEAQTKSFVISDHIDELLKIIGSTKTSLDEIDGVEESFLDIFIAFSDKNDRKQNLEFEITKKQIKELSRLGLSIQFDGP